MWIYTITLKAEFSWILQFNFIVTTGNEHFISCKLPANSHGF